MDEVNWVPSLLVLGVALLGGGIAAWRVRRSGRVATEPSTAVVRRDLEVRSDALLQQLRDLHDTSAKRSPEQLARERYALELEAAEALRALDVGEKSAEKASKKGGAKAPRDAEKDAAAPARPDRAALRGFLWGTGTMAGLALLLFYVSRSADVRKEGGQLTGNLPGEERSAARPGEAETAAPDAELADLVAAAAQAPTDTEAQIALARAYLVRQDLMSVWKTAKTVLDRTPGEPRALSYQAIVRLAMGQGDVAVQMLNDTLKKNPDFLEGYVHLATVHARLGQPKEGQATIDKAMKLFPNEADALRELWGRIEERGAAAATASNESGAPAPAPPSPAAGHPTGATVQGTVDLDPALKGRASGGVLFVMLRPDGFRAGPPLAAKRIANPSFPVRFEIGAADSMTGETLPESVLVQARLDSDGDPTTRDPADPIAQVDHVKLGAASVGLVLAPKAP